jgi:hypothetical protein
VSVMAAWLCRSTVIAVALPPKQAIELFTPEGERKWSAGWDPVYPRPERTAGPGAVFITGHDGHTTTWTMVDHTAGCVRYARVTPGVAAGTVTVALEADGAGGTRAQVTYDLTSLSADGDARLADFDRAYDATSPSGKPQSPRRSPPALKLPTHPEHARAAACETADRPTVPWASCGASQADARTHITGWQATFPCPLKGGLSVTMRGQARDQSGREWRLTLA